MLRPSLLVLAAALPFLASGDEDPAARWIRDLGADRVEAREAASKALSEMGEKAVPALRKALEESKDLEVRTRCTALLEEVLKPRNAKRIVIREPGRYQWRLRWVDTACVVYFFVRIPGRDRPGLPYVRLCGSGHGGIRKEQVLDLGFLDKGEEVVLCHKAFLCGDTPAQTRSDEHPEDFDLKEFPAARAWRALVDEGFHMGDRDAVIYVERTGDGKPEARPEPDPEVKMDLPRGDFEKALRVFGYSRFPACLACGEGLPRTDDPEVVGSSFDRPDEKDEESRSGR